MAQFKVKDLPRKERSAHNMIRIPAWVFGGLWSFGGLITLLVFIFLNLIETFEPGEFADAPPFWDTMLSFMSWAVFLSLGLGLIYIVLGFTYHRFIENGKAVMIGVGLLTILGLVLFNISIFDLQASIMEFMSEELSVEYYSDDFNPDIFMRFNRIGLMFGMGFSFIYYLVPALLGYIGFHKLGKLQKGQA